MTARLPTTPRVLLGPGDDAAVVAAPDGRVVVTTDLMVEGRHFRRDWSTAYDVGRKAAAANLADVVAMGALPTAVVVGLAAPADLPAEWADGLTDGLRDECARLGAAVVGGDVVAADLVMVAVSALGDLEGRAPVTRSGARAGDQVVLAGRPGRAAAGLDLVANGQAEHPLADAHRRPQPEYDAALLLASSGEATAMLDVSDGLLADLGHVAAASGLRIELRAAGLPVDPELSAAAELLGADALEWVVTGGDDHCFAATVPPGSPALDRLPVIGRCVEAGAAEATAVLVGRDAPHRGGHEHFA